MRTGLITALILLSQVLFSQDLPDESALFARTGLSGTARTIGSADAYGSVGADMGCIGINPAGLGIYRSTDFSITPMVQIGSNEAIYDGNHTIVHKPSFYLGQGGFVFTKIYKNASDNTGNQMGFSGSHPLKSISFAIDFDESNTFDRNQNYGATNTTRSLIDGYADILNQNQLPISNAPYEIQLAGQANFLGLNQTTGLYYSNIKAPVTQSADILSRGAINRINVALGANLQDKLYIGVALAVPILNYSITNDFTETPQSNAVQDYTFNTVTQETGFGFNGILGLIYRPFPFMRIGAAYHLPTWYSMNENYQIGFNEDTASYSIGTGSQPFQLPAFKYGLRTPMKGNFGASFYYKQYGFISVDYEIQNVGATFIHVPNDSLGNESYYNQTIKSTYTYTHTVHAGLEAAIKILRLRAGYSFSSSPFKKDQEVTAGYTDVRNAFTAGLGIRLTHFYVDLAYVYGWSKDASYQLTNTYAVNSIYNTNTILLTVGWKFEAGAKNKSSNQQRTQSPRYTPPPVDNDPKY